MNITRLIILFKLLQFCDCSIESLSQQNPTITKYIDLKSNLFYGTASYYSPMSQQTNFIENLVEQVDQSFLFSANFENESQIIAHTKLSLQENQITHTFILVQQQSTQSYIVSFNPLFYEGQLICTAFVYNAEQKSLQFIVQTQNDTQDKIFNQIQLEKKNVKLVFGGVNQNLKLSTFQGQLLFFLEDTYRNIYFYLNYLIAQDTCSQYEDPYILDQKEYDQENTWQLTMPNIVLKDYSIYFWHIFTNPISSENLVSLIHIDTQIQLNSQYSLGTNTLRINYEFIENEKIMVTVNYYSYEFPYILYNIDYIQSLIKNNQIGEIDLYLIYQWHFTTIQYQSNKLFIKIYYPHQGKYIEYKDDTVRQFSYAQFSLLFGESQNFKQSDGQVNQFKFKNCYEEFMDNYQCHYSCATCNGPLRNNCLSCPINSNREYEPEHNTCICQLWTQEQNQANCFYIQDITQMSVEYIKNINISELQNFDQIEPSIVCSYGYFLYEEDCYQCPSSSQSGDLICRDCLDNWQNWIKNSICKEYVLSRINYDFEKMKYNYIIDYGSVPSLYLFIENELRLCNYCSNFCLHSSISQQCNLIKEKHLGKDTYVECKYNFDIQTLSCIDTRIEKSLDNCTGSACNKQCQCCGNDNHCIQCINQNDLMLLNKKDCVQCTIQNCKFCFQYLKQSDGILTSTLSYIEYYPIINDEEYLIGCALCEDNYYYNFVLNVCQLRNLQISESCENYFIDQYNQPICLTTLTQNFDEGIEISDCFKYLKQCSRCIRTITNKLFCTTCYQGYFQNTYGYCEPCEEKFKECRLEYPIQYDLIIHNLQPFLLGISNRQLILYPSSILIQINIGICYENAQWSQSCYEIKNIPNCKRYYQDTCIECNYNETQSITLYKGQCYVCSYQCKICLPSLLNSSYIKCFDTDFQLNQIDQLSNRVKIKKYDQYKHSQKLTVRNLIWETNYSNIFNQQLFQRIDFIYLLNNSLGYYSYSRKSQNVSEDYEKMITQSILVYQNKKYQYQLKNLNLVDYQIIILNNLTIQISDLNQYEIIESYSKYGVEIKIDNLEVNQKVYLNFQKFIFLLHNVTNLSINNLTLININLQNFHLFKLSIFSQSTKININLTNIQLINCQLINSSIFSITQLVNLFDQNTIIFQQIKFLNCNFINSYFILFQDNQVCLYLLNLQIDNLSIQDTTFSQSELFSNYTAQKTKITGLTFQKFEIINSNFFVADLRFEMSTIKILNTSFQNSMLIYSKQQLFSTFQKEFLIVNGLFLSQLQIDSSLISLSQSFINFLEFKNIEIRDLIDINNEPKFSLDLFIFQANLLIIQNYFSFNFNSNKIQLNIFNSKIIELNNILIQGGDKLNYRINHETEFSTCQLEQQFLNIYNFTQITIHNISILNVMICNSNLIKIVDTQNLATLNFSNFDLNDILLLQLQGTQQTSAISISLTKQSKLIFDFLIIRNVFGNNYERLRKTFEQLVIISIIGPQSTLKVQNVYLKSNILTNSTNALLYLELNSIKIQNFTNIESNYFTELVYKHLNQEYADISIQALQLLFPIKSEGSVFNILCQKLELVDVNTEKSAAVFGGFCKIEFILDCELYVQNTIIMNSKSIQGQESKGGSFYINAKDTNLIMKLTNITISNSYSLYEGGFLFLIPSDSSNLLILENIKATGVFSIFRGFMSVEFSFQANENFVYLNNVDIQLEYDQIEDMTINYDELKDNELNYIKIKNGYFYFNYCQLQLRNINLYFEIVTQPIFYLANMQNLKIQNLYLEIGEQTSNTIIYFESIRNSLEKSIIIQSLQAKQVNVKVPDTFYLKQCKSIYRYEIIHLYNLGLKQMAIKTNNCLINQLSRIFQNVESIIQLKFLEDFKQFRFSNGLFLNFQKNSFSIALIDIYFQTNVKSKFESVYLLNNKCTQSTCLKIRSNQYQQINEIILKQIYIGYNGNSMYGQLNLENINYLIKQSYFINNTASEAAGAIYLNNSPFKILTSYFINNTAPLFGAIYCSNITNENREISMSKTFFLNNRAQMDMNSYGVEFYSLSLSEPIEKYQLIGNYTQISTFQDQRNPELYFLYLPSGQTIKQYQIFDMIDRKYLNKQLSLKFAILNYIKEKQLLNNQIIKCNITSNLIDQDLNVLQENISMFIAEFDKENSELNLENQLFVLNPYSENFLQIKISCDNIENNGSYEFFAKSYKCQMGEFFYEDQCLKCNASRGYYNLDPLNGECIKANPDYIKNHTENLLNLYEGFWRLDILTDSAEYCSNNPSNCLGGWETGDVTCVLGHLGALCEACDVYNIRGEGKYSKSRNYKCSLCEDYGFLIVEFLFAFIWAFSQIVLAVKSTQLQNQKFLLLKSQTRFYDILVRLSQDQSSSVIKLISNYFQIIMVIYTFKVKFISNLDSLFQFLGNSTYSTTYNFDCYISKITYLEIIYLNLIFILQVQFLQYILYLGLSFIIKLSRPRFFSLETIYASFFYLYLSGQINLIYLLAQLITPKTISNVSWISANLSYRYWTQNHQRILFALIIPLLIVFGIVIPMFLQLKLSRNKFNLSNYKIKQKYGYLFNEYSKTHYYWESVKLMYRQFLILIIVLLQDYIVVKGVMLIGLLFAYQFIFGLSKPYNVGKLNKFELSAIQICIWSFLLCILQYQIQELSESLNIICQILILVSLIILVTKSIIKFIYVFSSKYEQIIDYIKIRFVRCVNIKNLQNSKLFELSSKRKARVQKYYKIIKLHVIRRVQTTNINIQQTQNIEMILCSSMSPSQKHITPGRRFI